MVFKKLLSGKKKLRYSDLSVLAGSSDVLVKQLWIEKMRNYFVFLGYKQHLEATANSDSYEWRIDEGFMRKILKDHLEPNLHHFVRSDSSICEIFKSLERQLVGSLSRRWSSACLTTYTTLSSRMDEFDHHLNPIYFNLLMA